MILNLRGYDVEVRYIPWNKQIVADTLSRAAVPSAEKEGQEAFQEINLVLSVSEERYEESINKETTLDGELQAVRTMVTNGWPGTKQQVPTEARPYWSFRDKVATVDGLLFKETRLIVPKSMRAEMFRQIHKRHLGKSSEDREAPEQEINPELSLENRANLTVAKEESNQAAPPAVLPDPPSQEQHSQLPKESSGTPYVTRRDRQVVKPNRLDLQALGQFKDCERHFFIKER